MYKRIALFSPQLLENISEECSLKDSIDIQIRKVYGEDESDKDLECELELKSVSDSSYARNKSIYADEVDFVGKYRCILCPRKVLTSDVDLNKHLKSKYHKKMLQKWEEEQKGANIIREKFNEIHNLCSDKNSLDQTVNKDFEIDYTTNKGLKAGKKVRKKQKKNL